MSAIPDATSFLVELVRRIYVGALDDTTLFDLRLAVTETLANIVEHSYGNEPDHIVRLDARILSDQVEVLFTDRGRRPEPSRLKSRDLGEYRERGLGLFLISKCMDSLHYVFGRDGVNALRMSRSLSTERAASRAAAHHRPFHAATFEHINGGGSFGGRTICLFGHFDRIRPNPLEPGAGDAGAHVTLDLSLMESVDAPGASAIGAFLRAEEVAGAAIELIPPPASVCGALRKLLPDFPWSLVGPSAEDPSRAPAHSARIAPRLREGRLLPLSRSMSGCAEMDAGSRAAIKAVLCDSVLRAGDLLLRSAVGWGSATGAYFVRMLRDPEPDRAHAGALVFIGCSTLRGWDAARASSELFAALGAWPALRTAESDAGAVAGSGGSFTSLETFFARVSSVMRDLLPRATAASDAGAIHAAALRITRDRLRVVAGTGGVLAGVGAVRIRSVPVGASESFPSETFDVDARALDSSAPGADIRIHLGVVTAEEEDRWRTWPIEKVAEHLRSAGAADKGVLDVRIKPT